MTLEEHRPLALSIARDYHLPGHDRKDVEQEAMIGLWHAWQAFDEHRGVRFSTFATLVIRRRLDGLVRGANREKHRPLNESVREVTEDPDEGPLPIIDRIAGGRDPLEVVLDRETIAEVVYAARVFLTAREREGLVAFLDGPIVGDKPLNNAAWSARRKLRWLVAA